MTLPAGPVPDGLTDMDVDALTAPIGVKLYMHNGYPAGHLREVQSVRDEGGHSVRWVYSDGGTLTFPVGERVGIRVNLNDLRTAR